MTRRHEGQQPPTEPDARGEVRTYCRLCEPQCGLIATVEAGRLTSVRGNPDHALSEGYLCTKAAAVIDVTYDPDRVLHPLKRVGGPGEFVEVSWNEALGDIATRLAEVRKSYGADSFATFLGNPPASGLSTAIWFAGFQKTLGVRWRYSISSEDTASRLAASTLLYGSGALVPKPDLWSSDFVLLLGANPLVSHGTLLAEPKYRHALDDIVARGGRVVVVDPRRTETARRYEHVPIRAGTDAHLLLAMAHVLFEEDLVATEWVDAHTSGVQALARAVAPFTPDAAAAVTGVPAPTIRDLARALAAAQAGAVTGRTGTCTQRFGTLNNLLQDIVTILTGNLGKRGGLLFGWGPIDIVGLTERAGMATYGKDPTRVTQMPEVLGLHPSTSLVHDINLPGPGQVHALLTLGGNPVLSSAGGGPALEAALQRLDLHFSLDLYMNETNRYANYILPVTSMYERADVALLIVDFQLRPTIWASEAVVGRQGEVREDWEILDEITRRMGFGGAYAVAPLRWAAKLGLRLKPDRMVDLLLRTSRVGDWFGLRRRGPRLSTRALLKDYPNGIRLRDGLPIGTEVLERVRTRDHRIDVAPPELHTAIRDLRAVAQANPDFPMRLIGMREQRSMNSWLHNSARLNPSTRQQHAVVHPKDAGSVGLDDGDVAIITSPSGSIAIPITTSEDMTPGNIALPHGWGHKGGWRRANERPGVNSNLLASGDPADHDPLAGMSVLNGIPVRLDAGGENEGRMASHDR